MTVKQQIADFSQSTRNRLVFCHEKIEGICYVNIGKVLAESLVHEDLKSPIIAFTAEDLISGIMSSEEVDSKIGSYLAIYNIGILFEQSLGLNLKSILDSVSKNKTLIICSDGTIDSNHYYFLQKGDPSFIDLTGLSFIEI